MDYEQLGLTLPESTSLWADRRASVRLLLESVLELLTRATAGPNIYGSFAKLSPDGSWLKIALGCSQLTMDGSLETFSGVWPRRATMFAGIVGEPPTSERRTNGTGFSSSENWPTPVVADATAGAIISEHDQYHQNPSGNIRKVNRQGTEGSVGLARTVILLSNWPTPQARDYRSPTPPESPRAQRKAAQGWTTDLNDAVAMWPTPNASDCRDRGNMSQPAIQRRARIGKQLNLSMVVSETSGALNPDWDEVLMGYEPGWTKLPSGWKAKGGRKAGGQTNTTGSLQE